MLHPSGRIHPPEDDAGISLVLTNSILLKYTIYKIAKNQIFTQKNLHEALHVKQTQEIKHSIQPNLEFF